nr:MAG TPA: hypothetical protein [Caudoviricetes sp.]
MCVKNGARVIFCPNLKIDPSPPLIQPLITFNFPIYFLSAAFSLSLQYNIPPITRNALTRQINAISLQGNIGNKKEQTR